MDPTWRERPNFEYLSNMTRCIHRENDNRPFLIGPLGTDTTTKEQALALIMQELRLHDPIISEFDFLSDPDSVESLIIWVMRHLDQGISTGCYLYPEGTLVGVDLLYVRSIYDEPTKDSGKAFNKFIKLMKTIERYIKYYGRSRNKCSYLTSLGVFTLSIYRNANIPEGMILYRIKLAHSHRIRVIAATFIGEEMQSFAMKNDYKPLKTFHCPQDMMDCGLDFSRLDIFPIKIMDVFTFKREKKDLLTPRERRVRMANRGPGRHGNQRAARGALASRQDRVRARL